MLERNHADQESTFIQEVDLEIRKVIQANSGKFLAQMIAEHFDHPGKMVRPRMIYGLGVALGVPKQSLIHWAASCEILHNATLIHDDLQDGDEYRRGQPTTWKKYGAAQAINAGDLLLLGAAQPIISSQLPAADQITLLSLFSKMSCRIVNGQCLEFALKDFSYLPDIEKDYLTCIGAKTAALFSEAARGVGLIAHQTKVIQDKMAFIFDLLGKVFQLQDDILDLYGDKQRDSRGCDIKEGKISFLIVTHLKRHPEDLDFLKNILLKDRDATTIDDIQAVEKLFTQKNTLKSSISTLNAMIQDILEDSWLKSNPALHSYVSQVIKKILEPIEFLNI